MIIFSEYGLPSKVVSDAGTNFVSEKVENFCKELSIHYIMSFSYNNQNNFTSTSMHNVYQKNHEKLLETNADIYKNVLLQIRSTLIRPGLPSLAKLLFHRLARYTAKFSRQPVICDNNESNHTVVRQR